MLILPNTLGRLVVPGGQAAEGSDQLLPDLCPQRVADGPSGGQFGWQKNLDQMHRGFLECVHYLGEFGYFDLLSETLFVKLHHGIMGGVS